MTTHPDHQAFGFAETRYDPDTRKPIGTLAHRGLTKREEFAKTAMLGMLASESENYNYGDNSAQRIADLAVEHADALIAALNAEGQANG